jgi:cupin fold WbuC family metalloprotein
VDHVASGSARRAESAEVLYATGPFVTVQATEIADLVSDAARNQRRRIRLCAHLSPADTVHEMMIVHERSCYVRPHKHIGKGESFHIITGAVDVVLFNDDGSVDEVISMGTYESGLPFFYRIAAPVYHTLLIRSDVLVFHETTSGPFDRTQTEFPQWAPDGANDEQVSAYLAHLETNIISKRRAG